MSSASHASPADFLFANIKLSHTPYELFIHGVDLLLGAMDSDGEGCPATVEPLAQAGCGAVADAGSLFRQLACRFGIRGVAATRARRAAIEQRHPSTANREPDDERDTT